MNIETNDPLFKVGQHVSFTYPEYNKKKYNGYIEEVSGHSETFPSKDKVYTQWKYKIKVKAYGQYFSWNHYSGIRERQIEEFNEQDWSDHFLFLSRQGIALDPGRYILKYFHRKGEESFSGYRTNRFHYEVKLTDRVLNRELSFTGIAERKDIEYLSAIG